MQDSFLQECHDMINWLEISSLVKSGRRTNQEMTESTATWLHDKIKIDCLSLESMTYFKFLQRLKLITYQILGSLYKVN